MSCFNFKSRLSILLMTAFVCFAPLQGWSHQPDLSPVAVPGEFVIQLKTQLYELDKISPFSKFVSTLEVHSSLVPLGNSGLQVQKIRRDIFRIKGPEELTLEQMKMLFVTGMASFTSSEQIEWIEPNFIYRSQPVTNMESVLSSPSGGAPQPENHFQLIQPSDSDFIHQWGLFNYGEIDPSLMPGLPGMDIEASMAWNINKGSNQILVGVVDTGIDYNHPDLIDNVWTNEAEAHGKPGIDDDRNGYIDDIHGYNFIANNGDSHDDNEHGTHCAGIIGARGNNKIGVAGVNWNVKMVALKFLDYEGSGTLSDAIGAIEYARKNKIRILNNSWAAGSESQILKNAIRDAQNEKILFLAAAGNEGQNNNLTPSYPASYRLPNVISIAATDARGNLAVFSNFGNLSVDIAAPGVNIKSTLPDKRYGYLSGTSMATPFVTGAAALLLSELPEQSVADLRRRLLSNVRPLWTLQSHLKTSGLLNLYHSLINISIWPNRAENPAYWSGHQNYKFESLHPYSNNKILKKRITVPGAKRVSLHFQRFETESYFDRVRFYDGTGKLYGIWAGNHNNSYSPIIEGDEVVLEFKADEDHSDYGFELDEIASES